MTTRIFQIALVSKVDEKQSPWFNYQAKNIITYTLWEHLVPIAVAAKGFIPGPSWSLSPALLKAHDVVVHFVTDPIRLTRLEFERVSNLFRERRGTRLLEPKFDERQ